MANGKMISHGKGKYIFKNGDSYLGDFSNGEENGVGIFTYSNGEKYEGDKNGRRTGRGKFFKNGNKYEGEFWNGEKKGKEDLNIQMAMFMMVNGKMIIAMARNL